MALAALDKVSVFLFNPKKVLPEPFKVRDQSSSSELYFLPVIKAGLLKWLFIRTRQANFDSSNGLHGTGFVFGCNTCAVQVFHQRFQIPIGVGT
jgi:hypothetical protein